jgi:glycosyltransferase involved in cell wall biosynthesis
MLPGLNLCEMLGASVNSRVLIFCQPGTVLNEEVPCYGALRATMELANHFSLKYEVILVAEESNGNNFMDLPVIKDRADKMTLPKPEITIQISRGDRFMADSVNIICQHGPHHILGLKKESIAQIDAVTCVSRFSMQQQIDCGIPKKLLQVIPNGIKAYASSRHQLNRDKKTFVYAGHIRGYKGVALLLQAFLEFYKNHPEAVLHLYGENMSWDAGDYGHDWLARMRFLDNDYRIDWLRVKQMCPGISYQGEVTQDKLFQFFNDAGFLICPSVIPETFGLVSLEAQARGCIPLLASHGGFPETLVRSCPRMLFKPGDHQSLVRLMEQALESPVDESKREKIATEAASHTWDKTNARMSALINRLLFRKRVVNKMKSIFKR